MKDLYRRRRGGKYSFFTVSATFLGQGEQSSLLEGAGKSVIDYHLSLSLLTTSCTVLTIAHQQKQNNNSTMLQVVISL